MSNRESEVRAAAFAMAEVSRRAYARRVEDAREHPRAADAWRPWRERASGSSRPASPEGLPREGAPPPLPHAVFFFF